MNEWVMSPPRRMNSRKMRLEAPHLFPTTATPWYYFITYSLSIFIYSWKTRVGAHHLSPTTVTLLYYVIAYSFVYLFTLRKRTQGRSFPHFSPTTATQWYYCSIYLCIHSWKKHLRAPHLSPTTATLLYYLYGTWLIQTWYDSFIWDMTHVWLAYGWHT